MPRKRSRSATPDPDYDSELSQEIKRARRSDDDIEAVPNEPEPPLTQTEGDASDLEDNEEEVEQDAPNEEDEARFEEENTEKIRERVKKASETKGMGVSPASVIVDGQCSIVPT